jgi:phospholipid/cholesterol/gamma-HCH transport system ATP-binding protein
MTRPTTVVSGRNDTPPAPEVEVPAVAFEHVSLAFDETVVLRDISFAVRPGRLTVLLGASGTGKSVVLKLILGLLRPDAGTIRINDVPTDTMTEGELMQVRSDIGMLFQESALFDSLTVADNVGYRLYEETDMPADAVTQRVQEVLGFIGLAEYMERMPSELSGGQRRRVAIARAMASRPHLLLFDDPTSGLDPLTARTVINEIVKLRDLEHVTPVVVTHQLPDAFYIATHEAVPAADGPAFVPSARKAELSDVILLKDAGIYFKGTVAELRGATDPWANDGIITTFAVVAGVAGWEPRGARSRRAVHAAWPRCHQTCASASIASEWQVLHQLCDGGLDVTLHPPLVVEQVAERVFDPAAPQQLVRAVDDERFLVVLLHARGAIWRGIGVVAIVGFVHQELALDRRVVVNQEVGPGPGFRAHQTFCRQAQIDRAGQVVREDGVVVEAGIARRQRVRRSPLVGQVLPGVEWLRDIGAAAQRCAAGDEYQPRQGRR